MKIINILGFVFDDPKTVLRAIEAFPRLWVTQENWNKTKHPPQSWNLDLRLFFCDQIKKFCSCHVPISESNWHGGMLPGSENVARLQSWDRGKEEGLQGYSLNLAMISIFSIFSSKAGVKLTFYSEQILSTNAEGWHRQNIETMIHIWCDLHLWILCSLFMILLIEQDLRAA